MTKLNQSSQWNASRFLSTLSYFGEIPFLGSIRWLQQLLGRTTSPQPTDVMSQSPQSVLLIGQGQISTRISEQLRIADQSVAMVTGQDVLARDAIADLPAVNSVSSATNASVDTIIIDASEQSDLSNLSADSVRQITERLVQHLRKIAAGSTPVAGPSHGQTQILFNFANSDMDVQAIWGALDDVVMGGVSESGMRKADDVVLFTGNVSTANSGGFASVRTRNFEPPFDLRGWDGIRLRAKGDGNRYKFILRNSSGWDSVAYYYSFDTAANGWITVDIPFNQFIPTFRAKTVDDAPPLNPALICSFQFMLSKFEHDGGLNPHFSPGEFQLAIAEISAYRSATASAFPQILFISSTQSGITAQMQQQLQAVMGQELCCTTVQYELLAAESPSHPITLYRQTEATQSQVVETDQKALSAEDVAKAALAILQRSDVANQTWIAQRKA
ncbi:MAG: CIA30 family protein [Thainema sp.]